VVTLLLYLVLALVAVGCLYGLATLFLSRAEQMSPAAADRAPWALPAADISGQDIVELRLPVALRGYRFAETDQLLDRLAEEIAVRDREIARLRADAGSEWDEPGESLPAESSEPSAGPSASPADHAR
jgi:hypothetical protein